MYAERGYRIYYGSTHWVKKVIVAHEEKGIWYKIYDRVLKKYLYVPSYAMRLVPNEELVDAVSRAGNDGRHNYRAELIAAE